MALYLPTNCVVLPADQPMHIYKKYPPGSYLAKKYDLEQRHTNNIETLNSALPIDRKLDILQKAMRTVTDIIEKEIFPHWYNTDYDFYGMTETPGKGKIACGYFVTTVLRDVGVPIERVKMAQAASEVMIKNMTDEENIRRFPNRTPIKKFIRAVENMGEGIFVVGLDTHAGFLFYDGVEARFIHATARKGINRVINEKAVTSPSLIRSKYKVVGKISTDEDFIKRWLELQ